MHKTKYNQKRHGEGVHRTAGRQLLRRGHANLPGFDRPYIPAFRRGESPETICENFELLRLEEVYGAVAYYLANQADVDAYLIRQNEKWAEGKRNAELLPAIYARD